jgi:metallo-beta-lactamase family protein
MGVEVSRIHAEYPESYDEETKAAIGHKDLFGTSRVNFARSSQDSRKINSDSGPCVIIASSPTCEFGRVLHHLKLSIERKNDIVVFVGWTPPNTLGRRLQSRQERVRIYDRWYNVACDIRTLHGLSAHADCEELIRFLRPTIGPQTQFHVVHGEEDQSEVFAMRLLSEGASRVNVPAMESAALSL